MHGLELDECRRACRNEAAALDDKQRECDEAHDRELSEAHAQLQQGGTRHARRGTSSAGFHGCSATPLYAARTISAMW